MRWTATGEDSASGWSPARPASARTARRSTRGGSRSRSRPSPSRRSVDHLQPDPDAGDQAPRGLVVRSQRRPHPAYAAGGGDGRDRVHEGGADAEAVVVVDHLHGDLRDAGVVEHVAGDADRSPVHRGEPGHVAVTVDVGERLEHRRGQPDHPGEVAPGPGRGRHAVEDGEQRVPLPASQRPELDDAAAGEPDGHDVARRHRRGVQGQDLGGPAVVRHARLVRRLGHEMVDGVHRWLLGSVTNSVRRSR